MSSCGTLVSPQCVANRRILLRKTIHSSTSSVCGNKRGKQNCYYMIKKKKQPWLSRDVETISPCFCLCLWWGHLMSRQNNRWWKLKPKMMWKSVKFIEQHTCRLKQWFWNSKIHNRLALNLLDSFLFLFCCCFEWGYSIIIYNILPVAFL